MDKHLRHRVERRQWLNTFKDVPCMDCGRKYPPECMDFDHVRGEKKFDIGTRAGSGKKEHILEEIAKCDLVCANCHRTRTKIRVWERDSRCTVCGSYESEPATFAAERFTVEFRGACPKCVDILGLAFTGVMDMLSRAEEEQRERALARLLERLNQNGFETEPPVPASPPWFDPSIVREIR